MNDSDIRHRTLADSNRCLTPFCLKEICKRLFLAVMIFLGERAFAG